MKSFLLTLALTLTSTTLAACGGGSAATPDSSAIEPDSGSRHDDGGTPSLDGSVDASTDASNVAPDAGPVGPECIDACDPDETCGYVAGCGTFRTSCQPRGDGGPDRVVCGCDGADMSVPDGPVFVPYAHEGACVESALTLTWTAVESSTSADLRGVFALEGEAWAVGTAGTIVHWDGSTWSAQESGTTEVLNAVWASSTDDVWAVGDNDTVRRWDGETWTTATPTGRFLLHTGFTSVAADATGLVSMGSAALIGIEQGDFSRWIPSDSAWHLWLAQGAILGFSPSTTGGLIAVEQLFGSNVIAVHEDASGSTQISPLDADVTLTGGIWLESDERVWVTGDNGRVYRTDSIGSWTVHDTLVTAPLRGIWGTVVEGTALVWAVGDLGAVAFWSGEHWETSLPSDQNLMDIHGTTTNAWAVGAHGTILRGTPE